MFNLISGPPALVGMFVYLPAPLSKICAALIMTIIALIIANSVHHFWQSHRHLVMGGVSWPVLSVYYDFCTKKDLKVMRLSRKGLSYNGRRDFWQQHCHINNSENSRP